MKHGPSIAVRLTLYPLALILFLLVSAYFVFISAGYEMKLSNGRLDISKTGIIIVATRPGEANVTIDGEKYEKKTSAISFFKLKINRVVAGNHHLLVEREGYETWEGDVTVQPGFVSWLDYLILIPLERKADPYNFAGTIESSITSADQKRIMTYSLDKKQGIYNFWQINTENKESEKIYEGRITATEKIELLGYSSNNARFLYKKVDKNKKVSYVSAEAKVAGASSNISSLFNAQTSEYVFSPHNENEFYFIVSGNLYKINVATKTQSSVLASGVIGVYPNANKLLMVQKTDDNYGLWELKENNEASNIIKALPSSTAYEVTYVEPQKIYLVLNMDDKDLLTYANEIKNPTLETIAKDVTQYSVSPNGENVGIYGNGVYNVYNLEKKEYFVAVNSADIKIIDWFSDSANLLYATSKGVYMVNFDGDYNKILFEAKDANISLATEIGHNVYFTNIISGEIDMFSFSL